MSTSRQILALLVSFALATLAAAIGGRASIEAGAFYAALVRPAWAPPAWLFGPVWSILYALMAISAWGAWQGGRSDGRPVGGALALYGLQLAVNALWSWLFFQWHTGAGAFVGVVVLWLLLLATILAFRRIRPWTAGLLIPYLAWVTYATALTWSVWRANPALLGG